MKIGYSVEGSTDRAVVAGLHQRWCPQAELIEGHFRGMTHLSRRREIPKICIELQAKGADWIVFLTDSNGPQWRSVLDAERSRCGLEHQHLTVFGVCLRNVECWLCADPDYIANHFGRPRQEFTVEDPKGVVEAAFGITRYDKRENEIARFVRGAPLRQWLTNPSFKDFYDVIRQKSVQAGCELENLREN